MNVVIFWVIAPCGSYVFLARLIFDPEDGDDTFLRDVGFYKIHGATSQKTAFFIVTAVKNSSPSLFVNINRFSSVNFQQTYCFDR
jgi:hypothetical protein